MHLGIAAARTAKPTANCVQLCVNRDELGPGGLAAVRAGLLNPGDDRDGYVNLAALGNACIDYADMRGQFLADMTQWVKDGRVKSEETVENGIENAPQAFLKLFSGGNTGKMLVKLG